MFIFYQHNLLAYHDENLPYTHNYDIILYQELFLKVLQSLLVKI